MEKSVKEFYFIRHGQTDHNILEGKTKGDHTFDISLNDTGRSQAKAIEPLISTLPIQTICTSPLKRAQETKQIISERLLATHHNVDELGECSAKIWKEMVSFGMHSPLPTQGEVHSFMNRIQKGIDQALSLTGPALIVAHGGVHWAICCLLGIEQHSWSIDNCTLVRFSLSPNNKWSAKKYV